MAVAAQDATMLEVKAGLSQDATIIVLPEEAVTITFPVPLDTLLDHAVANAPEGADRVDLYSKEGVLITSREVNAPGLSGTPENMEPFRPTPQAETIFYTPPVEVTTVAPAPQLTPVRAPKQKRYTGPKEFSVALKAAENRLAKAIVERAQVAGQYAALQAEIPSLLGIIQALKGSGNYAPPVPYDLSGGVPNATAFQSPIPQYQNPLQAAQAAQPAPPISRAQGGTMQFSPDVVGTLENEEDDPDRYITGPSAGERGWIGG
jgi:hypothetical protein